MRESSTRTLPRAGDADAVAGGAGRRRLRRADDVEAAEGDRIVGLRGDVDGVDGAGDEHAVRSTGLS